MPLYYEGVLKMDDLSYTVKYRQPGQWRWRKLKRVIGDGVEFAYRFFHLENDRIVFVSQQAEVVFLPDRQKSIQRKMAKESGQPVQRA
jgi:hypothetical protein